MYIINRKNSMKNIIMIIMIYNYVMISQATYLTPSQNTTFTLGDNIIINSNISIPVISPQFYVHYSLTQYGWTTTGSIVQYVDPTLMLLNSGFSGICLTYIGVQMGYQFIDTDSIGINENYYQNFTLGAGIEYQLSFDWISETPNIESNGINITWNGNMVDSFYSGQCTLSTSTYYVMSINGTNTVSFQGLGITDYFGILIRNIQLRQVIYANTTSRSLPYQINNSTPIMYTNIFDLSKVFNGPESQQILKIMGSISSNKVSNMVNNMNSLKQNAKFAMGFILEFNHFLLYNTHLLKYTMTSETIILAIQVIDDQKGYILDKHVYPYLQTSPQKILSDFSKQNDLPSNPNSIGSHFTFRSNGFLLDIIDTVLMNVPTTASIFFIGIFFFKILFRFRISLLFRQYSLLGIFFITLLDGKLEILTFYFLSEVLLLTTSSFTHKLKTVIILFVYFMCFVFAVGSMYIFRWLYQKRIKYFYDNCKKPFSFSSIVFMNLSFGFYNIVLGFLHRILLSYPKIQLYALIAFETLYLFYIFSLLFRNFYQNKLLALTLCLMNTSRIAFLMSLLAYQLKIVSQEEISAAQLYIFYSFLVFWILTSVICILDKIRLLIRIIYIDCKKSNKVSPSQSNKPVQKIYFLQKNKNQRTHINLKSSNQLKNQLKQDKFEVPNNSKQKIYQNNRKYFTAGQQYNKIKVKCTKMLLK